MDISLLLSSSFINPSAISVYLYLHKNSAKMLILTKASLSDSFDAGNQIGHTKYLATRNFNGAHLDIQSQRRIVQTPPSLSPTLTSPSVAGPSL